jgi:hypothetical protein
MLDILFLLMVVFPTNTNQERRQTMTVRMTITIEDNGKHREFEVVAGSHLYIGQTHSDGTFKDWNDHLTAEEREGWGRLVEGISGMIRREDARV